MINFCLIYHFYLQVAVEENKQLFVSNAERGISIYGSIAYQMKDANMESNTTCEFVYKALKIFSKTSKFLSIDFLIYFLLIVIMISIFFI